MVAVSFHGHNFARLLVLAIGKQRTTVSTPNYYVEKVTISMRFLTNKVSQKIEKIKRIEIAIFRGKKQHESEFILKNSNE